MSKSLKENFNDYAPDKKIVAPKSLKLKESSKDEVVSQISNASSVEQLKLIRSTIRLKTYYTRRNS